MKVLFLINNILEPNNGVTNKILNQFTAFTQFASTEICHLHNDNGKFFRVFYQHGKGDNKWLCGEKHSKYKNSFLFDYSDVIYYCLTNNPNVIYIRYTHFSNPLFIRFLSKIKENGIKVILEIPNYPYDNEYDELGWVSKLKLLVDKIYRYKLSDYVDGIATMSEQEYIFDIPVIKINNAVSSEYLSVLDLSAKDKDKIVLVAAANLARWHGYDRLIISLSKMPKDYVDKVEFHLVGGGEELINLKHLASDLGVSDSVIFHGEKDQDYLRELYCTSHIGVDSLGRHRSKNYVNDSIKSKEYLACGLPVIMSHVDPILIDNEFVFKVASNDNPFDLKSIIDWYEQQDFNSNRHLISNFAQKNCTWDSILYRTVKNVL